MKNPIVHVHKVTPDIGGAMTGWELFSCLWKKQRVWRKIIRNVGIVLAVFSLLIGGLYLILDGQLNWSWMIGLRIILCCIIAGVMEIGLLANECVRIMLISSHLSDIYDTSKENVRLAIARYGLEEIEGCYSWDKFDFDIWFCLMKKRDIKVISLKRRA